MAATATTITVTPVSEAAATAATTPVSEAAATATPESAPESYCVAQLESTEEPENLGSPKQTVQGHQSGTRHGLPDLVVAPAIRVRAAPS